MLPQPLPRGGDPRHARQGPGGVPSPAATMRRRPIPPRRLPARSAHRQHAGAMQPSQHGARARPCRAPHSKGSLRTADQLAPESRIGELRSKVVGFFQLAPDLLVDLLLVFIVVGQCAVDLSQREMGTLEMDLFRTRSVCDLIQNILRISAQCTPARAQRGRSGSDRVTGQSTTG